MTHRSCTIDDVEMLIARGRLARSRAFAAAAATVRAMAAAFLKTTFAALARRVEQARTLRELRRMDARMLADIGLTRSDVEAVAAGKLSRAAIERPTPRPANESADRTLARAA